MKKLSLDELKVESFVTSMTNEEKNTVDAGAVSSPLCIATVIVVTLALCVPVATAAVCPTGVGPCNTRDPYATPCPATNTSNCPGGPTLMGPVCPNAVATDAGDL
jgi:hypothetical protein